jgi:hypothetical protein
LDFIQVETTCEGVYDNARRLGFAKLGSVVMYLCQFEEEKVNWADVKIQMGRLNAECVHGVSGITG